MTIAMLRLSGLNKFVLIHEKFSNHFVIQHLVINPTSNNYLIAQYLSRINPGHVTAVHMLSVVYFRMVTLSPIEILNFTSQCVKENLGGMSGTQQKPISNRWPVKEKAKYRNEAYSTINRSRLRRPNFRYLEENLIINYTIILLKLKILICY